MGSSLLQKAKDKAKSETKDSKKAKVRLTLKHDKDIFAVIKRQAFLKEEMAKLKAESDILDGSIKEAAIEVWANKYDTTGINPETVMVEMREKDGDLSSNLAQFMFIVQDRYLKISEEESKRLAELYGDDVVTDKTIYKFNEEMIEKYGELIAEFIETSDKIANEDRDLIIEADNTIRVAKEIVKKFAVMAKAKNKKVIDLVNDFRPIIGTKNTAIIQTAAGTAAVAGVTPIVETKKESKGLSGLKKAGKKS
jgi:hypothetical protein